MSISQFKYKVIYSYKVFSLYIGKSLLSVISNVSNINKRIFFLPSVLFFKHLVDTYAKNAPTPQKKKRPEQPAFLLITNLSRSSSYKSRAKESIYCYKYFHVYQVSSKSIETEACIYPDKSSVNEMLILLYVVF